MSELYQSLSHSQWDCQYQVVLGAQTAAKVDFRAGTPATGCDFPRAGPAKAMPDYGGTSDARPCACGLAIPPKHPEASVIGFLRGKSAIAIARRSGQERNFTGEHFWARGLRGIHRRFRAGAGPSIPPRAGSGGWPQRKLLKLRNRRATRDA